MAGSGAAEIAGRAAAQGLLRRALLARGAAAAARRLRRGAARLPRGLRGDHAGDTLRRADARVRARADARAAEVAGEDETGALAVIATLLTTAALALSPQAADVQLVQPRFTYDKRRAL